MNLRIAGLCALSLIACSPAKPARAPDTGPKPGADAVFEVLEATGKTYVMLGPASSPPETRSTPIVIGHGLALEISGERPIDTPLSFTVVGTRGACTSSASTLVKISGGSAWVDAVKLDGCRGDPAEQRLALMGQVTDARWLEPKETMTADGEPVPTSGFFEGSLDGKLIERKMTFTGLDLSFEQKYREPTEGPVATRVVANNKTISSFYATLDAAVRAGQRWLFVVANDDGERSVLELRADTLLPRLGVAPPPAPIKDEPPEAAPKPAGPALASKPAAEIDGDLRARRAPEKNKKGGLFLVNSLKNESERVDAELTDEKNKTHRLEIHWPAGLEVPFAKGQRIRITSYATGGGPNRRTSLVCESENGRLLLAVNASPKAWKVTRGKSYTKEVTPDRIVERFAVSFQHGEANAETRERWASLETSEGTYYLFGNSAKVSLKKGPRPPDFMSGWLDYAIVLAR